MGVDSVLINVAMSMMVTWLGMTADLPVTYDHPRVALASPAHIAELRYPTVNPAFRPNVLAVYDDEHRTIYLHEKWTGMSPADLSVLVHELVHHLQNSAGLKYECQGGREAPAYAAQSKFLGLFGRDLVEAFELDPMALKLMTNCLLL